MCKGGSGIAERKKRRLDSPPFAPQCPSLAPPGRAAILSFSPSGASRCENPGYCAPDPAQGSQVRGSALAFVEEGLSDGAKAPAGALGSEEFQVDPSQVKSHYQLPQAAVAAGGTHPPFGWGDGKRAPMVGMQGVKEPGRVRRRT